ncbi:gamma-glutamylcyclotransferase [Xanthobacteraceae bacterium A53D]
MSPDPSPVSFQPPGPVAVPAHDPWVFGYGSLMWKPGFDYVERAEATLIGAHRSLCIFSFHHRGTPEQPGLVLGLDTGGSCKGVAFRVAAERWPETHAYLTEREQISGVYRETARRVRLKGASVTDASAVAYVANRAHPQYARGLSLDDQLHMVRRSHGMSGPNADYVLATVDMLAQMDIKDQGLTWIARHLRAGSHP